MSNFRVRNKQRQVAGDLTDTGLFIHDQKLAWQLQRLREAGETPFRPEDADDGRDWNLESLISFLEANDYTVEPWN